MVAGLTHAALAERAGLSVRAISDLERGVNRRPRKETLTLLAEALGLSAQERAALEAAIQRPGASAPPELSPLAALAPGGALPPLVGRAPEIAMIERHLASAGPAVVIFLAGEPGIGKSRLLYETAQLGAVHGWTVLAGGCHRRSGQEPYEPFLSALERYISSQSPSRRRLDLRGCEWLVRLLPELAEMALVSAPTWTLPPEQERRLMFGAVGRLLANAVGPAGTLLLLDDLQWAGQDALDLLAALVRARPAAPLRVVGAYRDTEIGSHSSLGVLVTDLVREGRAARASLGPLPVEEAAVLLTLLMGEAERKDATLHEQVLERAGGVPYFLVSCAQAMRTGPGDVDQRESRVPWDVAETIRQRVAALPPAAQELLAVATVVGQRATRPLLISLVERPAWGEAEVLAALDAACRARLLSEAEEDAYAFAHDLVREVVGGDLSAARRAALHRRVAEALERGPGEPPAEALAYHFGRAGEPEKEIVYLERAGARAETMRALSEAEGYYRELVARLDGLGRADDAARAREKLGSVQRTAARYEPALVVLQQALERYRSSHDVDGLGRAGAQIGWVHALRGTPKEGILTLKPVLDTIDDDREHPSGGLAAGYVALAQLYFASGQYSEQLAAAKRAAELARAAGDSRTLAVAEGRRGVALYQTGQSAEAGRALEEAVRLNEMVGDMWSLCSALNNVGWAYENEGAFEKSMACVQRGLEVAEGMGDTEEIAFMTYRRGENAFYLGLWRQARSDYERAASLIHQLGSSWAAAYIQFELGRLSLAEGQSSAALRCLDEALALAERSGDLQALRYAQSMLAERDLLEGRPESARVRLLPLLDRPGQEEVFVTLFLPLLAWAHLALGNIEEAVAMIEQSISRASAMNLRLALVDALRVQAMLATHQGRWPEAEAASEQALSLAREMRYPYAEVKVLYDSGLMSVQQGKPAQAREQFEAARAICGRLGERLYAEHVEQALAHLS
jgi:tetratricopeptide (TPR) repeat protein/transcriptional regulator with XRE-family HTH domain